MYRCTIEIAWENCSWFTWNDVFTRDSMHRGSGIGGRWSGVGGSEVGGSGYQKITRPASLLHQFIAKQWGKYISLYCDSWPNDAYSQNPFGCHERLCTLKGTYFCGKKSTKNMNNTKDDHMIWILLYTCYSQGTVGKRRRRLRFFIISSPGLWSFN